MGYRDCNMHPARYAEEPGFLLCTLQRNGEKQGTNSLPLLPARFHSFPLVLFR